LRYVLEAAAAAAALAIAIASPAPAPAEEQAEPAGTILERVGYAYAPGGEELLYAEHHREHWREGRILRSEVQYRDPDGKVYAVKKVDFGDNPLMPEFELRNRRNGHFEKVERVGEALQIVFRHPEKGERRFEIPDPPAEGVIDAGFDRWVARNWDRLVAGERLERPFLVPSAGRFIDFRIEQVAVEERDGRRVRRLRMEPDGFLIRLATQPIDVEYLADEPVLLAYEGLGNMRGADGGNQFVQIEFPVAERERIEAPALAGTSAREQKGADAATEPADPRTLPQD